MSEIDKVPEIPRGEQPPGLHAPAWLRRVAPLVENASFAAALLLLVPIPPSERDTHDARLSLAPVSIGLFFVSRAAASLGAPDSLYGLVFKVSVFALFAILSLGQGSGFR